MVRAILLLAAFVVAGNAQTTLKPTGSNGWHLLGDSMAISGNTAALCAKGSGRIFIREHRDGAWATSKVLEFPGNLSTDFVALSGDHLATRSEGKLRMFSRHAGGLENWGLVTEFPVNPGHIAIDGNRMLASASGQTRDYEWDPVAGNWIQKGVVTVGTQVPLALSGDTAALVGYNDNSRTGIVETFKRDASGDWNSTGLVPSQIHGDWGTVALALEGDWMALGIPGRFTSGLYGEVHVYHRDLRGARKWKRSQILKPAGVAMEFGASVAISGNRIAVGMVGLDQTVHVFERKRKKFELKGRFIPSTPVSAGFGRVLALSGDHLLASDLWRHVPNNYAGDVFSFNVPSGKRTEVAYENEVFSSPPESFAEDFGRSIAMDGNTLAVGASLADDPMAGGGEVSIYAKQPDGTWILEKKLSPGDLNVHDRFGSAVALDGDILAASSPGDNSIHLFSRNQDGPGQWGAIKKLSDYRVRDLSISGETLAATDSFGAETHLFERNLGGSDQWGVTSIPSSGEHVELNGNLLVLSGGWFQLLSRSGFGATDWSPISITASGHFETRIAASLSGDTLAIGGVESETWFGSVDTDRGFVSIRRKNQGGSDQWGEVARLYHDDRKGLIGYGTDVALRGNMLVVGAPRDTTDGKKSGSIYVYRSNDDFTVWTLVRKIRQIDPADGDLFGVVVATNGDDVAGGAPLDDDVWQDSGAVFISSTSGRFDEWVKQNLQGAPENPEDSDPDHDGLSSLQEFAMGLSPNVRDTGPKFSKDSDTAWRFDYPLAKDAPGTVSRIEWSADLETWRSIDDGLDFSSAIESETPDSWNYKLTIPMDDQQESLFLRMQTEQNPFLPE